MSSYGSIASRSTALPFRTPSISISFPRMNLRRRLSVTPSMGLVYRGAASLLAAVGDG